MTGLLIDGILHPVPGLTIIPPASHGGPAWAALDPGDYRARPTPWIRQIILHTTGGNWPQPVRAGAGPAGHARQIADMWRGADRGGGERIHSGSQIIVDFDGSVVCLCDLARCAAYHAEGSNYWSIGIEMCTMPDGSIYSATLDATVTLTTELCKTIGIPEQMPRGPYSNEPLKRMETGTGATRRNLGGPSCVGVFGHRDNTSNRGFGDPGDEICRRLERAGVEELNYDLNEDLEVGRRRQTLLNAMDAAVGHTYRPLTVDGECGPASLAAMRRHEFARWKDVA
jgi:hypothetical protein